MKYAEYTIENQRVAFHNSLSGVESIQINGEYVSRKFSWFGKEHIFYIGKDQFIIRPYPSITNWSTVGISVYKNGLPVQVPNRITKSEKWNLALRSILHAIICGGLCFIVLEVVYNFLIRIVS